jgi:cobalamin 5'-phosphate synthase/cobalamin synthase
MEQPAAPQVQDDPQERVSPLTAFLTALQFLLVSPAFIRRRFTAAELGAAVGYYPLVGLLLGSILAGAGWLLGLAFPPLVVAALLLILWTGLTGALHLDGFLDTCDGLLGGYTPEDRLRIMRDERVGAYAVAGGVLLYLAKFAALASLTNPAAALLLAPVAGRWAISLAVTGLPYARPSGLGREVKDHAGGGQALLATCFALLAAGLVYWLGGGWQALAALPLAGLLAWALGRLALRLLPGMTGDLYGTVNEIVEMAVLVLFTAGSAWL